MPGLLTVPAFDVLSQASPLLAVWSTIWPYLAIFAGFSVIVFVHELGHFAVAKWAGVRVEKFAIGFGREIFGFSKGETRYSFNVLPLGGYVKMLGQEDFDDKSNEWKFKEDPRSFANKPVGHRMAIVSAGVIMNILFACFLFMIVFMVGMEAGAPRIGFIEPDSPAERAGLQPGDIVHRINGERMLEFSEIRFAVLLASPHEPVEFIVERNDEIQPPILIRPEYRQPSTVRDIQRQVVGIAPGFMPRIVGVGPEIDTTRRDQPRFDDRLVEVAGIPVTADNVTEIYHMLAYVDGEVVVERHDPHDPDAAPERVSVQIPPLLSLYPSDSSDPRTVGVLGLTPLVKVSHLDPEGRAALAGIEVGDAIISWNDKPHPSQLDIMLAVRDNPERDMPFTVRKANGRRFSNTIRPKEHRRGAGTIQAFVEPLSTAAADVKGDEPSGESAGAPRAPRAGFAEMHPRGVAAQAGLEVGDEIISFFGHDFPDARTVERVIRNNRGRKLAISVRKADGRVYETVVPCLPPGSIDAGMNLVANDLLMTGEITPEINGRPSPAAEAGIPAGARILEVQGEPLTRWQDMIAAFRRHAGSTVELVYADPDGRRAVTSFDVPHCLRTKLGVGPEATILSIDGEETVTVRGGSQDEELTVRYHEGTRAKLAQLVGRKQVAVEFRANPLAERQSAMVDVTEEMVDPWLGRVVLSPNVDLYEETFLLKGKNIFDAVAIGAHKTWYFIMQVYRVLERLIFTRSVGIESVSGPLGIIDMGGQVARTGLIKFLFFMAIISANLAVINFLPLPIVDGGLMVFLIIEKIKGSPVGMKVQVATQMIGLVLIVGFFLFVTYQDALRLLG